MSAPTEMSEKREVFLTGDVAAKDAAELRDIADWFERKQGSASNAEFLRQVALRHEVLAAAYARFLLETSQTVAPLPT